jgi:hypothetical protein
VQPGATPIGVEYRANNKGLTVPAIAPTTAQQARFDGVKNAFQLISHNLAHHSSQKYYQPMTMKHKLKPILITTAGVATVSLLTWWLFIAKAPNYV